MRDTIRLGGYDFEGYENRIPRSNRIISLKSYPLIRFDLRDTIEGYDLRDTIRFEGYDSILRDTILRDTKIVSPGSVEGYDPLYFSDFLMSGSGMDSNAHNLPNPLEHDSCTFFNTNCT